LLRGVTEAGLSESTQATLLAALQRGADRFKGRSKAGTPMFDEVQAPERVVSAGLRLRPAGPQPARLLVIGASTGGPHAVADLLLGCARPLPVPVVVVQHMAEAFVPILAGQLDGLAGMPCRVGVHGEALQPGHLYLAPGDRHLLVVAAGAGLELRLSTAAAENFCRPSVDPLLRSAVSALGGQVLAVILTGMGQDGLEGVRGVIRAGGTALAQDEASSAVWGMPGTVAGAGLCHAVLPPQGLGVRVRDLLEGRV
jgi:two-component system chemotaxis response regulator CheB